MVEPESLFNYYKIRKMCDKAVNNYAYALEFVPDGYQTQTMYNKAVNNSPAI